MSEQLKELRAQRELIQTHLTWLDTQIATTVKGGVAQHPASPDQLSGLPSAASPTPKVAEEPTVTAAQYCASDDPTIPPASAIKIDQERQLATGTSDVRRAQIGCFLCFAGSILLFLFSLFGLPYLID